MEAGVRHAGRHQDLQAALGQRVAEEAQTITEHKLPTIQLLDFTDGIARGRTQIRFCHYSPKGAFQRSPLIIDESEIAELRQAIRACPRLHRLLQRLVA